MEFKQFAIINLWWKRWTTFQNVYRPEHDTCLPIKAPASCLVPAFLVEHVKWNSLHYDTSGLTFLGIKGKANYCNNDLLIFFKMPYTVTSCFALCIGDTKIAPNHLSFTFKNYN